jgi:hypothetical protein
MGRVFDVGETVQVYYGGRWEWAVVLSTSVLNRRMYGDNDPAVLYTVCIADETEVTVFADHGIMPADATDDMKNAYLRWYVWMGE